MIDQDRRDNIVPEWSKTTLEMWNQMLRLWMGSEAFVQGLGRGMESYLFMYSTSIRVVRTYMDEVLRMMNIAPADETARSAQMVVNLENKIDRLTDEVDRLAAMIEQSRVTLEKMDTHIAQVKAAPKREQGHEYAAGDTNAGRATPESQ
jgi:DNA integrity scanning protein DisA with diadenylate cyclase activity